MGVVITAPPISRDGCEAKVRQFIGKHFGMNELLASGTGAEYWARTKILENV